MFRKCVFLSVVMVLILGLFACGSPKGDLFPDSNLATATWEAIGKPADAIAPSDLEERITLDASETRIEFFLIPLVAFIAALVVVLLFPPTRGGRRRGLLRSGLIVGVVFTGLYTLWTTIAFTFDVVYLENLIFWVWIPGLALYGIMVLVVIIGRKKA